MKTQNCYASGLDACEGELTQEHIITECLLGDVMLVDINGERKEFKRDDFKLPILCRKHNNMFSAVEAQMKDFTIGLVENAEHWSKIRNLNEVELKDNGYPLISQIKGEHLERWIVKLSLNYLFFIHEGKRPKINIDYLAKRLFKNKEYSFVHPYGLYILGSDKRDIYSESPGAVHFTYYTDDTGYIHRMVVNLQGYLFMVVFPTLSDSVVWKQSFVYDDEIFEHSDFNKVLYHGEGYRQFQYSKDNKIVVRAKLRITWKNKVVA